MDNEEEERNYFPHYFWRVMRCF